ncbi:MAG: hypothetical protein WA814_11530 [Candidatus Baltobacteraceae bacterium]
MALPPGAPPALAQIAQRFQESSRGIVSFSLHRTLDVHAAFRSRHEDQVLQGIYQDGAVVKVRVVSDAIDGKAAPAAEQTAIEERYDHPRPGDAFEPPFDPRYVDAYQYQAGNPGTVTFTSSLRDAAHGSGSFTYDSAGNVLAYTYQPGTLPPYATSATVSDQRAEVLPGLWAVTQETQQYKGSYGPFAGAGTVSIAYSNFKRFSDIQSALDSIQRPRASVPSPLEATPRPPIRLTEHTFAW